MKTIIRLLIAMALCVLLLGCSKEDETQGDNQNPVINVPKGYWGDWTDTQSTKTLHVEQHRIVQQQAGTTLTITRGRVISESEGFSFYYITLQDGHSFSFLVNNQNLMWASYLLESGGVAYQRQYTRD